MKRRYRLCELFLLSMLLLSIVVLSGCEEDASVKPSGEVVKIGVIAPLSGSHKEWGENGILGIRTMLKVWPYLANGDKPELVIENDGNDPAQLKKAFEKLVREDNVAAVIVFSRSSTLLPAVSLVDQLETPTLVLIATHPDVARSRWINQLIFDDEMQGKVAALYARDELLKNTVAVFRRPDDPHFKILADVFRDEFEETGGTVYVVTVDSADLNYEEIVGELQEKGVELIFVPLKAAQVIEIKKAANAIGWDPEFMVGDGLLAQFMLQYDDQLDLTEGMLAIELYSNELHQSPYGKEVVKVFEKNFQARGTTFATSGVEGMAVLMTAMNRCTASDNKACLQRTLRGNEGFAGLMSRIRISSNGKAQRPIFINAIRDEHLVPVAKVN